MGVVGQTPTVKQQIAGALMAQRNGWLIQAGTALLFQGH